MAQSRTFTLDISAVGHGQGRRCSQMTTPVAPWQACAMNILRRTLSIVIAMLFLPACHAEPSQPTAELSLRQRSTSPLPGWDPALQLGIDDITGGAVLTWIDQDGRRIAGPQRLSSGTALRFEFREQPYQARLVRLDNALIGDDFATFAVAAAGNAPFPSTTTAAAVPASVDTQIEQLLARLAAEDGAELVRNGSAHPAGEAIAHLRRKWKQQHAAVKSLDDFIRLCATRSEQTGQPYLIRFKDGREMELATWLREAL
jgi:hypothetical protein